MSQELLPPEDFSPEQINQISRLKTVGPLLEENVDDVSIHRLEFLKWRIEKSGDGLEGLIPEITLAPEEEWRIPTPENPVRNFKATPKNLEDLKSAVTSYVDMAYYEVFEHPDVIHEHESISTTVKHQFSYPTPIGDATMIFFGDDDKTRERIELSVYEKMLNEEGKITKIKRVSATFFLDGWFDVLYLDFIDGSVQSRTSYFKPDNKGKVASQIHNATKADLEKTFEILNLGIEYLKRL